jgi:HAMP domain-containing protein
MTTDLEPQPRRRRTAGRSGWFSGIRVRVLTIALVPSIALFITGAVVVGSLLSNAISDRNLSGAISQGIGATIQFHDVLEGERTTSLLALGGDQQAMTDLPSAWQKTNVVFTAINQAAARVSNANPQAVAAGVAELKATEKNVDDLRQAVRARKTTASQVDTVYTALASGNANALLALASDAPTASGAVDLTTTLDLLLYLDDHSRVVGLGGGWAVGGSLSAANRIYLAQVIGTYQNGLAALTGTADGVQSASALPPDEQASYLQLTSGTAWKTATAGEQSLLSAGRLNMPLNTWLTAENTVSSTLLTLWNDNFRFGDSAAQSVANQTLNRSILLGVLVLVLTVAAFALSLVLANRLARRLRRLRDNTLELADVRLPSMVRRVTDGEPVDVDAELALADPGSDEIGQVAAAFNTAQRTAVIAAAAEAATRSGINKVFLDIAHRSQLVVHRQLEVLDVAEARQGDPEHLELLFQLDHLATRARRNAENLLILGGGQPGRRWRQPAALEDVVRSAVSETEQFARVDTVRLPDVRVQGTLVGDLIHLIAELVDNATAFSPPDSVVTVRGNTVGKGVVVEIDDQGLGIEPRLREQYNETLRNPPGFQAMAMTGERHLGLFVIGQLAGRHGVGVSLLESAYGGIRAIVLIPSSAIEPADALDGGLMTGGPADGRSAFGQHEQPIAVSARAVRPTTLSRLGSDDDVRPGRAPGRASGPAARPGTDTLPRPPWEVLAASSAPGPAARERAPLPRRERMANLAPGLRPDANPAAASHPAPRRAPRTPEEAHGSMSAFQRGTRLGRDIRDIAGAGIPGADTTGEDER